MFLMVSGASVFIRVYNSDPEMSYNKSLRGSRKAERFYKRPSK